MVKIGEYMVNIGENMLKTSACRVNTGEHMVNTWWIHGAYMVNKGDSTVNTGEYRWIHGEYMVNIGENMLKTSACMVNTGEHMVNTWWIQVNTGEYRWIHGEYMVNIGENMLKTSACMVNTGEHMVNTWWIQVNTGEYMVNTWWIHGEYMVNTWWIQVNGCGLTGLVSSRTSAGQSSMICARKPAVTFWSFCRASGFPSSAVSVSWVSSPRGWMSFRDPSKPCAGGGGGGAGGGNHRSSHSVDHPVQGLGWRVSKTNPKHKTKPYGNRNQTGKTWTNRKQNPRKRDKNLKGGRSVRQSVQRSGCHPLLLQVPIAKRAHHR
jgi:hypothetical protein